MWKIPKAPSTARQPKLSDHLFFLSIYLFIFKPWHIHAKRIRELSFLSSRKFMDVFFSPWSLLVFCLQLFLVQFDPVQLDLTCYQCTPQRLFRVIDYVAKLHCMCHNALGRNRSSGFVCPFHVHHLFIRKGSKFFFLLFEILASSQFPPELKAQRKHICVMGNMKTCSKKKCIQRLNVNKS